MTSLLKPVLWSEDDSSNWLAFVQTNTGGKLLALLCELEPGAGPTSDPARHLGIIAGHRRAVELLKAFTQVLPEEKEPTEQYPDLDDNTKWGKPTT